MSPRSLFKSLSSVSVIACGVMLAASLFSTGAKADTSSWGAARVLQEALSTDARTSLFNDSHLKGFNLTGGVFSGYASGIDTTATNYLGNAVNNGAYGGNMAQMDGDQHVYAMMLDGRYQFEDDLGTGLPLHPYMSGGFGMAVYDGAGAIGSNLSPQGGDMVPLFRVGGGVAYALSNTLNMSVDYRVGFSGSDSYMASHGIANNTDMQTINMGMHYRF